MRAFIYVILGMFILSLNGCGSHVKIVELTYQDTLENKYISFNQPVSGWYVLGNKLWTTQAEGLTQWLRLYKQPKGASYTLEVETSSYSDGLRTKKYFNKNSKYRQILYDKDMELDKNEREQGIGYTRSWVNYVQGLKCTEGVFSRSPVGMMRGMSSKNYSLTCGYYDKSEGKRLLHLSYRYSYAGGSLRHQKDANTPHNKLITLKQAELSLKNAVKQLIETIKIKNFDRERMEREGLIHVGEYYKTSPF